MPHLPWHREHSGIQKQAGNTEKDDTRWRKFTSSPLNMLYMLLLVTCNQSDGVVGGTMSDTTELHQTKTAYFKCIYQPTDTNKTPLKGIIGKNAEYICLFSCEILFFSFFKYKYSAWVNVLGYISPLPEGRKGSNPNRLMSKNYTILTFKNPKLSYVSSLWMSTHNRHTHTPTHIQPLTQRYVMIPFPPCLG